MSIIKSILSTFAFILFTELIAIWLFIDFLFDIREFANSYYVLTNGVIEIGLVTLFLIKTQGRDSLIPRKIELKYYIIAILIGFSQPLISLILNSVYDLTNYISWEGILKGYVISKGIFITDISINSIASILLIPIAEELFLENIFKEDCKNNIPH